MREGWGVRISRFILLKPWVRLGIGLGLGQPLARQPWMRIDGASGQGVRLWSDEAQGTSSELSLSSLSSGSSDHRKACQAQAFRSAVLWWMQSMSEGWCAPRSARRQAHATSGTAAHSRRLFPRPEWCQLWERRCRSLTSLQNVTNSEWSCKMAQRQFKHVKS